MDNSSPLSAPSQVLRVRSLTYEERLKREIKEVESHLNRLKNTYSKLAEMKYKPGDTVYHKEHGKGMVREPQIGPRYDAQTTGTSTSIIEEGSKLYQVAFVYESVLVLEEELIPASEAAEGLYGQT